MAETEVESILREIRERVLSQQHTGQGAAAATVRAGAVNDGNGDNGAGEVGALRQLGNSEALEENLALIEAYLTTTARAWDRLPPLVSNRSGPVSRIELWLKRLIRAGTHWFTWEQVNFNAAVHYSLRDTLQVLRKVAAEAEARRVESEQQRAEMNARLAEQLSEIRERDERLQDQQRVCFKQLSLETSEAAVLEDRARRKAEALLEELTRRVEQLEKSDE